MLANARPGKRSCQAGPFATRESHLSERQRSAIRCRSTTRCSTPRLLRCSLMARPACPPPMTSVSTFSTDMHGPFCDDGKVELPEMLRRKRTLWEPYKDDL